jgi:NTP pyrophosphatase (non-canonical NTP hydrolase)
MIFENFKESIIKEYKDNKLELNNKRQYMLLIQKVGVLSEALLHNDKNLLKEIAREIMISLIILAHTNNIDLINKYRDNKTDENSNLYYKFIEKIGGIATALNEKNILGKNFKDFLKKEIKKSLYYLIDLLKQNGIKIEECLSVKGAKK